jgi:hypothetical protein
LAVLLVALVASFCNYERIGQNRCFRADADGECCANGIIGLQGFQLIERAVKGALEAGVMAREAVKLWVQHFDNGLELADAAEIPGGGDEFVKERLLGRAARIDLGLVFGQKLIEFLLVHRLNGELLGAQAMLKGILRTPSLAFWGARSGTELGVGLVGNGSGFCGHEVWFSGLRIADGKATSSYWLA